MCGTWPNVLRMPKMIQVRNVPDDLHRTLKVRAAERGMSLSDYVLSELEAVADKPTLAEWLDWRRAQPGSEIGSLAADIIRAHRGPLA